MPAPLHPQTRKPRTLLVCAILLTVLAPRFAISQNSPAPRPPTDPAITAVTAQLTTLRDSFVSAVSAAGFPCPIAPPTIVIEDIFSYGAYEPTSNTLTVTAWELLKDNEKARFYRIAGPDAKEAAARKEFETGVHHWVIVHELGHWYQACRHLQNDHHYAFESAANRIAAAWWRAHDNAIVAHQQTVFRYIASNVPGPALEGQTPEAWFDAHYPDKFASAQDYIWFQARMCLAAFDEKPVPTFVEALRQAAP